MGFANLLQDFKKKAFPVYVVIGEFSEGGSPVYLSFRI